MDSHSDVTPSFKKFFAQAMPRDGGVHTLMFGEHHNWTRHVEWLNEHLKELKKDHALETIGIEYGSWFNPFLWAYQDGTLERALGSKVAARDYLLDTFKAYNKPTSNAVQLCNLCIRAMDSGICVVAFDSRRKLSDVITSIPKQQALDKEKHIFLTKEVAWVTGLNPEYKKRFSAVEQLIEVGHQKIEQGKLTSDGLSSVMFDALGKTAGNRITINGIAHIDGAGYANATKITNVHGTFGNHLFAISGSHKRHTVTHALMAGTGALNRAHTLSETSVAQKNQRRIPIQLHELDMDFGLVETSSTPPYDPRVVSLEKKFPSPFLSSTKHAAHIQAHINPLLIPDIKAAADAVRAAMNPEERGRPR